MDKNSQLSKQNGVKSAEKCLLDMENFFINFNQKLKEIEVEKENLFELLLKKLDFLISKNENSIKAILNKRRDFLLTQLNKSFSLCFAQASILFKNCLVKFIESTARIDESSLLIGNLVYNKKFSILKKFSYFNYLNQYINEIELNEELIRFSNVRILILNQNRLFSYLRTNENKTYFKIFNKKWQELNSIGVDAMLIYRNVISWNSTVASLFYNPAVGEKNILSVYNEDLKLKANRSFNFNLNLCCISENEIICWNTDENISIIFDFNLNVLKTFGQDLNEGEPFYFANGILIEGSPSLLLFYFCNQEEQTHFIKIIDRKTGILSGVINFEFNYFSKMIRIDNESNILVKLYEPSNELKYYDSKGTLLKVFTHNDLTKFSRIDLSQNDDIICFDKTDNKILFF